jgi:lipoprotein-anchoring transpeptidase ErfK/SrfK
MNPQTEQPGRRTTHGKVDMSPEAIDQRLDMVSVLHDPGRYLQTA